MTEVKLSEKEEREEGGGREEGRGAGGGGRRRARRKMTRLLEVGLEFGYSVFTFLFMIKIHKEPPRPRSSCLSHWPRAMLSYGT